MEGGSACRHRRLALATGLAGERDDGASNPCLQSDYLGGRSARRFITCCDKLFPDLTEASAQRCPPCLTRAGPAGKTALRCEVSRPSFRSQGRPSREPPLGLGNTPVSAEGPCFLGSGLLRLREPPVGPPGVFAGPQPAATEGASEPPSPAARLLRAGRGRRSDSRSVRHTSSVTPPARGGPTAGARTQPARSPFPS